MDLVFTSWPDLVLTENHIRQLHRDLLVHSDKDAWHRGSYKTAPNNVAAFDETGRQIGIVFETASPFDTHHRMRALLDWLRDQEEAGGLHPLLRIAAFVVVFLAIHPFQDGNGRLSRILTTLLLLRAGYGHVPYASLESVVEQNKEAYYLALRQTQATLAEDQPQWQPWLTFFLRVLREQARRLARKIDRERLVAAALPELALAILDHLREHGRLTMRQAEALTGANRNTLKQHFRLLLKKGHVALEGAGRGAWYRLP